MRRLAVQGIALVRPAAEQRPGRPGHRDVGLFQPRGQLLRGKAGAKGFELLDSRHISRPAA